MAKKRINVKKKPLVKSKEEALFEAKRYLENAKEIFEKAIINDDNSTKSVKDIKYARIAAGTAYLAALMAIDGYLLAKGETKLPNSIEEYQLEVGKMTFRNKAMECLNIIYENLHLYGYYWGATDVNIYKSGFSLVKDLIVLIENSGA